MTYFPLSTSHCGLSDHIKQTPIGTIAVEMPVAGEAGLELIWKVQCGQRLNFSSRVLMINPFLYWNIREIFKTCVTSQIMIVFWARKPSWKEELDPFGTNGHHQLLILKTAADCLPRLQEDRQQWPRWGCKPSQQSHFYLLQYLAGNAAKEDFVYERYIEGSSDLSLDPCVSSLQVSRWYLMWKRIIREENERKWRGPSDWGAGLPHTKGDKEGKRIK